MYFLLPLTLFVAQVEPLLIPGEQLVYDVTSSKFGKIGRAEMRTQTVTSTSGSIIRLSFETNAKVLLFKATDHTVSELDAADLRTVRYSKRERSPIGKRDENVSIDYLTRTWNDGRQTRPLACDGALDELSVIYLIRALEMGIGQELEITRHFDRARNPIKLRSIPNASDSLDVIEMTVPDKRQDSGVSVLRFYLTRDRNRLPVRIESSMPVAGRITMTLQRPM